MKDILAVGWWGSFDEQDELDNEDDEFQILLQEYEKKVNGKPNKYHELTKDSSKNSSSHPDMCKHVWENVGTSPVLNEEWFNCKKCKIKKEVYEKSLKSD